MHDIIQLSVLYLCIFSICKKQRFYVAKQEYIIEGIAWSAMDLLTLTTRKPMHLGVCLHILSL